MIDFIIIDFISVIFLVLLYTIQLGDYSMKNCWVTILIQMQEQYFQKNQMMILFLMIPKNGSRKVIPISCEFN